MNRTTKLNSFADLKQVFRLTLVPRRRRYLVESDAIYDFTVGHEFVVDDASSPFDGCIVSCLDTTALKQHGYTHVLLHYNTDRNAEVVL